MAQGLSILSDNLLERLISHGIPLTRIGHPARVLSSLHNSTLDSQASRSDESALANDVKAEIEETMGILVGKGKGKPKGAERKKLWEDVRELRKECVNLVTFGGYYRASHLGIASGRETS